MYEDSVNVYRDIKNAIRTAEKKKIVAKMTGFSIEELQWILNT